MAKQEVLWISGGLQHCVVARTEESHHCYDWSRAHVADQVPEERLMPQVPVVFPEKILRCLIHLFQINKESFILEDELFLVI